MSTSMSLPTNFQFVKRGMIQSNYCIVVESMKMKVLVVYLCYDILNLIPKTVIIAIKL